MAAVNFKEAMLLDEAIAQIAGLLAASNMLTIEVDTRIFLVEDYELELHVLSIAWPNINFHLVGFLNGGPKFSEMASQRFGSDQAAMDVAVLLSQTQL